MKFLTPIYLSTALLLTACATSPETQKQASPEVREQIAQLVRLGDRTAQGGDHANALGFYQRAYSLDSTDPELALTLANALKNAGDKHAGEQVFAHSVERNPNNAVLLHQHGKALIELDKLPQAIIQLKKAQGLAPTDLAILNALGVAYDLSSNHMEAQRQYEQALAVSPNHLDSKNNLALSLALAGEYERAITLLSPYSEDTSAPKRLRLNLALIYGLKGDETNASAIASKILDREAVENNLRVYERLRNADRKERNSRILKP